MFQIQQQKHNEILAIRGINSEVPTNNTFMITIVAGY